MSEHGCNEVLDKLRESEICFRVTTNFCGYFDAELGHYHSPIARVAQLREFASVVEWLGENAARLYPDSLFAAWRAPPIAPEQPDAKA